MKRLKLFPHFSARVFLSAVFLLVLTVGITSPVAAASKDDVGAVYTSTNAANGNEILVYNRAADGSIVYQGSYATGGLGSGAGLGSQSAVVLSNNNHWLFAVNAGSNQVSVFAVNTNGLELIDVVDSGGTRPVSLTNYKDLLYVLNAGGSGNISGFAIGQDGSLSPLAGSTQPLSNLGAGAAPGVGQIAFNAEGSALVVTEKSTSLLDIYEVGDGIAGVPVTQASAGAVPFGFAFDRHNHAIVSEASGSVSSYEVADGGFNVISPAVVNTQVAACWIAISNNGKFAYTTNAGSGSISSYRIASDGSLTLLNATAALTGAGSTPIDMAFSNNGSFMYTLAGGAHTVTTFQFRADGSLGNLSTISVPAGATGLAAR